ncbi:hypothetical protein SAMN05216243_2242 [Sediminibacillus albus]|uniref:Uncharacterized protein n=1 Tax=Sediminibacillus albus TaxID=407036 RepID=A0A1G8ZXR8_9BACI|nr:hypothetical protein SAMN05216243_2242 [Sediminibacillus albus]
MWGITMIQGKSILVDKTEQYMDRGERKDEIWILAAGIWWMVKKCGR